jgi:hypothetical protein
LTTAASSTFDSSSLKAAFIEQDPYHPSRKLFYLLIC